MRPRVLAAAGVLALAAAVLLFVRGGLPGSRPSGSLWQVDRGFAAASGMTALLGEIQVDGQRFASLEAFEDALDGASTVEVGTTPLRIRRGEEFVIELADGALLSLAGVGLASQPGSRAMVLERGAIRIATGPGFVPGARLEVATPHVVTEVLGTVYGIDVWGTASCVCCLQGEVSATTLGGVAATHPVTAERTRLVRASGAPKNSGLVPGHRPALERLTGYWP